MLEEIVVSKKIEKDQFNSEVSDLELKLGELQRQAKNLRIPVMVVFEGWSAAGKGTLINELIRALDPRGFKVYTTSDPTEEEALRPFLWRFWTKTPEKGRITIFDRSWYRKLFSERFDQGIKGGLHIASVNEINSFERQLCEDGNVIIKFFLHISKKEQKKRFEKLEGNKATKWRVTNDDWEQHEKYDECARIFEEGMEKTDSEIAPWNIIEANDKRFATIKIYKTVISFLEKKINDTLSKKQQIKNDNDGKKEYNDLNSSILEKINLSVALDREEYETNLKKYQKELRDIEHELYKRRVPLIILYEGWDAAGKGGNIRRLTGNLDPRGYEVIPFAAPNDVEKAHHYLWRFWNAVPKAGHINIFDRSWYGRVLVERVEGFCSEAEWKRAYREINEMEEQFVNFGAVVVKFWLHIDKDEQLKRFEERKNNSNKVWKITDEDWRNRDKWDYYKEAVDEMLFRTSTTYAPWTIIESNDKYYARIKALKTVVDYAGKKLG